MKFVPLLEQSGGNLSAEYRAGRRIGVLSLGRRHLFFRKRLTAYYLPYGSIQRYFRRVEAVPVRMGCCGDGELRLENLVLCGQDRELVQIQLPGERAALAVLDELSRRASKAAQGVQS